MLWREQGKDQMSQCFTGIFRLGVKARNYVLRIG
jgi:hypothetical protein